MPCVLHRLQEAATAPSHRFVGIRVLDQQGMFDHDPYDAVDGSLTHCYMQLSKPSSVCFTCKLKHEMTAALFVKKARQNPSSLAAEALCGCSLQGQICMTSCITVQDIIAQQ